MPRSETSAVGRRSLQLKREIALKRIDECLTAGVEAKIDTSRLPVFLSRYSRLESYCTSFEAHHLKLCSELTDPADLEKEDEFRADFDSKYFQIIEIHNLLTTNVESRPLSESQCFDTSVKLPRLNLMHFDGDIKSWGTFYDMFNTMVHQNRRLSNIERFSILISLLRGEPLQLLKGFPLSENNYLDAYAALIDRYQCKRKLAFHHWEELQNFKCTSASPRELRRLVDTFKENIAVLKNLRLPVNDWDFPLFYLLINKLDQDTRRRFELQNDQRDIPSFNSLLEFLDKASQALDLAEPEPSNSRSPRGTRVAPAPAPSRNRNMRTGHSSAARTHTFVTNSSVARDLECALCSADHSFAQCSEYQNRSPHDRFALVKEHRLCVNCLRPGHVIKSCMSKSRCLKCGMLHHTTLHFDRLNSNINPGGIISSSSVTSPTSRINSDASKSEACIKSPSVTLIADPLSSHTSLLATAVVDVIDNFGYSCKIRVVIDSGSQSNFITKKCAHRLGLPLRKANISVEGIGQTSSIISCSTTYRLCCTEQNVDIEIQALAVPKICSQMPTAKFDHKQWPQLNNLRLADPNFNVPDRVDALIGVDVFCKIFLGDRVDCGQNGPTAFNTKLGWIVMGNVLNTPSISHLSLLCSLESLDIQLRKFWEVDELPRLSTLSEEEALCESIYADTHTRLDSGRYVVRLPFKTPEPIPGDSYSLAYRRLLSLEKRLSRVANLREEYNAFMKDYIEAGHMELASTPRTEKTYFMPHHCVLKPSSNTTRLRVVFDASARPADGPSLNEQLLIGPKLQTDIVCILLRFRLHSVVFTADVKQMYRQILISEDQRDYQRILFRFNTDEPIREYRLNTVTYGMSSSSFLALRTIRQVAIDEGEEFPLVSCILSNDIYVDDIVTGADSLEAARVLQKQIIEVLSRGCFELRKWASNSSSLLDEVPREHCNDQSLSFNENNNFCVKILGLEWNPTQDTFSFSSNFKHEACTKRNVLSELARIFDPLGFITPLTFAFKCIVQRLWLLGLGWDEPVPDSIAQDWFRYRIDLASLTNLNLCRFVPISKARRVELHGFCDASELGYAAAVYCRVEHSNHSVTTHLILSRSKVASLKKVSIPRLELCGAVLLSDLVEHVKHVFTKIVVFDDIYCWTDSMVVLSWLKSQSSRWKTYVANRVGYIQEKVPPTHWYHVRSEDNPTDCASRGLSVQELIDCHLWWSGPEWLSCRKADWPSAHIVEEPAVAFSEQRNTAVSLFVAVDQFDNFLDRHSSLKKIQRIVAYIRRFVYNCRNTQNRKNGHLVASELSDAMTCLVKLTQASAFSNEIERLKRNLSLPKSLRKLQPFIDESGLVRVGGRLVHSELDYDCKHPFLLPRQHRLTSLLIDQVHNDNMHPGLRTLNYLLAQNYWILSSRRAINTRLSRCVRCYRANPKPIFPRMGDLPKLRISQVKPFSCVGVDFAGPFPTYVQRYRGSRTFKTYICLFVCFATKAVHIELVSSLSTEAFIAALRRFIARRGRCQRIHCDRGTNFVGAYNSLYPLMQQAAASEAIEFAFNPPAASHFGGLWEINVRSFKTHLTRTVGNQILTYEEFLTFIVQIEALLNSRPLSGCEMGSDPKDMSVLTPGHFLTLEPLTSLPETQVPNNISLSNRWQLIQKLHRDFWKRWHVEYLHTLNQRAKWHTDADEPKIDSLVLIKDEQLKPLNWSLGRIVKLHPGRDGISRVATIQTLSGQMQRPLVKLCPLPIDI